MKSNLIDEVGTQYFAERFGGCMFFDAAKRPSFIDNSERWPNGKIKVGIIVGPATKPTIETGYLPYSFFKNMSVFATPPLGWRSAAQGRYMVHMRRRNTNNGYHRGIAPKLILPTFSPATEYLFQTGNISEEYYMRPSTVTALVMNPEYVSLKEGLPLMREGELFSFAVNPNIAVIPDVDEKLGIYFNTKKVATIDGKLRLKCESNMVGTILREHL